MKRIIRAITFICVVMTIISFSSCSSSGDQENNYPNLSFTLNEDGTSYTVKESGYAHQPEVHIPSEFEGLPVTAIADSAFRSNKFIEIVIIPDTVEIIGERAFENSTIKSIVIPDSVSKIGQATFRDCHNLTSCVLPNTLLCLEAKLFSGCSSLESVNIPNCVSFIGDYTFAGNSSLEGIMIPVAVNSIGEFAFSGCSSLENITIPDAVTSISWGTFAGCTSLKNVVIPDTVTQIGIDAFSGCASLTSFRFPKGITTIEGGILSGCTKLEKVIIEENSRYHIENNCIIETSTNMLVDGFMDCIIPNTVTTIGRNAFSGCDNLTSITIPEGVTFVDEFAFSKCLNLTSITIPASLTQIGISDNNGNPLSTSWVFYNCPKLANIKVNDGNTRYSSEGNCLIDKKYKILLIGTHESTIPDNVKSIGTYAFAGHIDLTSITIPKTITTIGNNAFDDCTYLTNITYNGTTDEWFYIEKDPNLWHGGTQDYIIHCTDGDETAY